MGESSETILIFAANPKAQARLSLDMEVREIENGLRRSRKHFVVQQSWATRPVDLRRALLDHKPRYVHFCGHGGTDGIVLEGQLVNGDALAELFGLFPEIKCIVLNACYSKTQAQAIAKRVDYVVGMSTEIGDSAAIEFAVAFYDALGAGESVEFAFDLGRVAIQVAGIPEYLTPQLLSRQGSFSPAPTQSEADESIVRRDWDGAPAVSLLYGREAVAELLRSWILEDFCRVVLITGMGGIGKTDLATCLGRGGNRISNTSETLASGIQGQFDCVLWRSLLNAPAPDELFADILGVLSSHQRIDNSSDQAIEEILECLQVKRCLVILDNVEAVLRAGDPMMRYRRGYERYGELFELVAKTTHQSCLLLTSREKPRAIAQLEGVKKPVRSISLTGIGTAESQDLFAQISTFSGEEDEWDQVVTLYAGNPLALELVARHVDQVFDGDLTAFLHSGRSVFTDLEELLDWHIDRLAPAETELIYWLAIEREPVTIAALDSDLIHPASRERIASTLQSLQRRIPLEHIAPHKFSLQPVLIEYLTNRLVSRMASAFARAIRGTQESPQAGHDLSDSLQILNSHALCKATANESVRTAQQRLIVRPIADQLASLTGGSVGPDLLKIIDWARRDRVEPGYLGGNLINLMAELGIDLKGINFSQLSIWQAALDDLNLHSTDFSFANFRATTFRHAFGTAFSLSYSADGELIAVGDDNGEILLFSPATGQLRLRCVGHSDVISAIKFSSDGQFVASASFDNSVCLWRLKDGQCVNTLLGHEGWVYSLDFSPDAETLATASEDGTCRLWDLRTGRSKIVNSEKQDFISAVVFSPDGQFLAVAGSAGVIEVFRVSDLSQSSRLEGHKDRIRSLAFSRQGDLLASGAEDRQILLWQAQDATLLGRLRGHTGAVMSLSFSDAGDILASGSNDHSVRLWSTGRKECVGRLYASDSRVWSVSCSPTQRTVAAATEDSAVRVWDLDSHHHLTTLRGYSNKTWALSFGVDESQLAAANEDSLVRVWNIRYGQVTLELRGHASRVWAVARSLDGNYLCSASDDLTVRVWSLKTGSCTHVMRGHSDWIRSVAFSADSRTIASAGEDGKIMLWDAQKGTLLREITGHLPRFFSVAFLGNSNYLAAGGAGHEIYIFNTADGLVAKTLEGHEGWLTAVVPLDEFVLASCSEDGTARVWDLRRNSSTHRLAIGHKVWCGVFCNEGQSFLTGSEDGTLQSWRISNETCEATTRAHQGSVWALAVNPAEDLVATAGDDGVIRLWGLPDLLSAEGPNALRSPRPYEGMNITAVTGLTPEQRKALSALGAIEMPSS